MSQISSRRRWRLTDGCILAEARRGEVSYYLFSADGIVKREFAPLMSSLDDYLYSTTYLVSGRHLIRRFESYNCRDPVEISEDVEIDELDEPASNEAPTTAEIDGWEAAHLNTVHDKEAAVQREIDCRMNRLRRARFIELDPVRLSLCKRAVRYRDKNAEVMLQTLDALECLPLDPDPELIKLLEIISKLITFDRTAHCESTVNHVDPDIPEPEHAEGAFNASLHTLYRQLLTEADVQEDADAYLNACQYRKAAGLVIAAARGSAFSD
jgi:hypothetical protein